MMSNFNGHPGIAKLVNIMKIFGYSYIQLLSIAAIVLLLATIATPSYRGMRANHHLRVTTITLQQAIVYARSTAIRSNTQVNIKLITATSANSDRLEHILIIKQNGKLLKRLAPLPVDLIDWFGFDNKDGLAIFPNGMTFNNGHFNYFVGQKMCSLFINHALKTHAECNST